MIKKVFFLLIIFFMVFFSLNVEAKQTVPTKPLDQFSMELSTLIDNDDYVVDMETSFDTYGVITHKGRVFVWGRHYGIPGDNLPDNIYTPIEITNRFPGFPEEGDEIIKIRFGQQAGGALTKNGKLYMWGSSASQLTVSEVPQTTPIEITALHDHFPGEGDKVIDFRIGGGPVHALTEQGKLFGWGFNGNLALGIYTYGQYHVPMLLNDLRPNFPKTGDYFVQLAGSYAHTGVLTNNGDVFVWGDSYTGNGTTTMQQYPQNITDINTNFPAEGDKVTKLYLGSGKGYALTEQGHIYGWGSGTNYVGDGTTTAKLTPVLITTPESGLYDEEDPFIDVKTQWIYSMSVIKKASGKLYVWGQNGSGELGLGHQNRVYSPTEFIPSNTEFLEEGDYITDICPGDASVFLSNNKKVYTIGYNYYGNIGNGTNRNYTTFQLVDTISHARTFTLSFDTLGGNLIDSITALEATTLPVIEDPVKPNYVFDGWYLDNEYLHPVVSSEFPRKNSIYYAKWTPETYTITYHLDEGIQDDRNKNTYSYEDETFDLYGATKRGHQFMGWYEDLAFTGDAVTEVLKNHIGDIILYAKYQVLNYTLTWYSYDGNVIEEQEHPYGEILTQAIVPIAPIREGYTFIGYDHEISDTMPDSDLDYLALYQINTYILSFNTQGGTPISSEELDYHADIITPNNPTKEGYTFNGWNPEVPTNMPASNLELTAIWTPETYTITYHLDEGIQDDRNKNTYSYEDETFDLYGATKRGHQFMGWYEDLAFTGDAVTEVLKNHIGDIILYAKYQVLNYTLTWYSYDGNVIEEQEHPYGEILTQAIVPIAPIREGYTFIGYDHEISDTMPDSDLDYLALYQINTYILSFNTQGGTPISSEELDYHADIITPNNPTKEGYTFNGWNPEVPTNMPASNLELTAIWTPETYTITYHLDEGIQDDRNKNTYSYEDETFDLYGATKRGHQFMGWYEDLAFTGDAVTEVLKNHIGDIILYAKYQVLNYTLTWYSYDGNVIEEQEHPYGEILTQAIVPIAPIREGYTFIGYDHEISDTMPDSDLDYLALYQINTYILSFNTQGGTPISSEELDYHADIITPNNPTKEGYTFNGWNPEVPTNMPASNLELIAIWTPETYTITYHLDEGIQDDRNKNTYSYEDETFDLYGATKRGHQFMGWYEDLAFTGDAVTEVLKNHIGDIILYAKYQVLNYTLTWYSYDGNVIEEQEHPYGEILTQAIVPIAPIREGYTFIGYDHEISDTMPDSDLDYLALYQINTYILSFNTQGGTPISSEELDYHADIITPNNPTKEGYTFNGWNPEVPTNMPASNLELTAIWTPETYTITYHLDEGIQDDRNKNTYSYEDETFDLYGATKRGHQFMGWYEDLAFTGDAVTEVLKNHIGDIILYAKYQVLNYTLTWYSYDGNVIEEQEHPYGEILTQAIVPIAPIREGYTFIGYDHEISDTMPDSDLDYLALYQINTYILSFNTQGGTPISSEELDYHADIITPNNPTKEGYTFNGWNPEVPTNMPASNLELTAIWTINSYQIIFNLNGGEGQSVYTFNYQEEIPTFNKPSKPDCMFNGYSAIIPDTMPSEDVYIDVYWLKMSASNAITPDFTNNLQDYIDESYYENKQVEIELIVKLINKETLSEVQIEALSSLEIMNSNLYLQIEVRVIEENEEIIILHSLSKPLEVNITLPTEQNNHIKYQVSKYENVSFKEINSDIDTENSCIRFAIDGSSIYVITYESSRSLTYLWWVVPIGVSLMLTIVYLILRTKTPRYLKIYSTKSDMNRNKSE